MAAITPQTIDLLATVISGSALEDLLSELDDPGAWMSAGDYAKLGAAFKDLGAVLTDTAKALVEPEIRGGVGGDARLTSGGVDFAWRKGGPRVLVDSAAVRREYPRADYPDLYRESFANDAIAITLPKDDE